MFSEKMEKASRCVFGAECTTLGTYDMRTDNLVEACSEWCESVTTRQPLASVKFKLCDSNALTVDDRFEELGVEFEQKVICQCHKDRLQGSDVEF